MKPIKKEQLKEGRTYYAIEDVQETLAGAYIKVANGEVLVNVLTSLRRNSDGTHNALKIPIPTKSVNLDMFSNNVRIFKLSKDEELMHIVADEL